METPKPIGYWLKHLDGLLEEHFAATLAEHRLTRRQWQALNVLEAGPCTRESLRGGLAPFLSGEQADTLGDVLDVLDGPGGLIRRGWVEAADGLLTLTPSGYAGRAGASARVMRTREVVLGDLTPEQFAETVRTLAVMAGNVEADLARLRP